MKLKNLFFVAAAALMMGGAVACSKAEKAEEAPEVKVISVDELFADAENLVGDTVVVEGECSHLCSHGARKAFLLGADSSLVLRCEASAEIGAFAPDCVGKVLEITGIVCESRIDSVSVAEMEARQAATNSDHGCETEAKAQGQAGMDTFAARMEDYRSRIAERYQAEGKNYLSFYYLDALSYEQK